MRICSALPVVLLLAIAGARCASAQEDEFPYELWLIDADGANPRKLCDTAGYTCGSPDWSPDGKQIAYDTWKVGQTWNESQIAVVPADGSRPPRVIGHGGMPSWSPDGTQIACHTYSNPQTIDVLNADGTGRETIINHWGSPRWFPSGNRIASLTPDREIMEFDLIAGRELSLVRGQRALSLFVAGGNTATTVFTAEIGFAVSPDGKRLCFGDGDGGLHIAGLGEFAERDPVRAFAKALRVRHCSFSPDGNRVVFAATPSRGFVQTRPGVGQPAPEQLYLLDVKSTFGPRLLPGQDAKRNNSCPDWSPDGKTIVFVRQQKND